MLVHRQMEKMGFHRITTIDRMGPLVVTREHVNLLLGVWCVCSLHLCSFAQRAGRPNNTQAGLV